MVSALMLYCTMSSSKRAIISRVERSLDRFKVSTFVSHPLAHSISTQLEVKCLGVKETIKVWRQFSLFVFLLCRAYIYAALPCPFDNKEFLCAVFLFKKRKKRRDSSRSSSLSHSNGDRLFIFWLDDSVQIERSQRSKSWTHEKARSRREEKGERSQSLFCQFSQFSLAISFTSICSAAAARQII